MAQSLAQSPPVFNGPPSLLAQTHEATEQRVVRVADAPIPFEAFLDLGEDAEYDLIDGVLVERMAAQIEHEGLFGWLYSIMRFYAEKRGLGLVFGSRTAIKINDFRGCLPDILFVRQENAAIVQRKAIYGVPDLVIEIVSPGDRPSDIAGLETDYRGLGVTEIVYVNLPKQHLRVVRKRDNGYTEETLTTGTWTSTTLLGFAVEVEWLLREPRPIALDVLLALLAG